MVKSPLRGLKSLNGKFKMRELVVGCRLSNVDLENGRFEDFQPQMTQSAWNFLVSFAFFVANA